jgi:hypothetical protein
MGALADGSADDGGEEDAGEVGDGGEGNDEGSLGGRPQVRYTACEGCDGRAAEKAGKEAEG